MSRVLERLGTEYVQTGGRHFEHLIQLYKCQVAVIKSSMVL